MKKEQIVVCPACQRQHIRAKTLVDEFIDCNCGHRFYAFGCGELRITMPQEEACCESIARAMRCFVVSTGRCTDIPRRLLSDEGPNERFIDEELEQLLAEYQSDAYGECLIPKGTLDSICESLAHGHDVELKKQKSRVDVIELTLKKPPGTSRRRRIRSEVYGQQTIMSGGFAGEGILKVTQWPTPEGRAVGL